MWSEPSARLLHIVLISYGGNINQLAIFFSPTPTSMIQVHIHRKPQTAIQMNANGAFTTKKWKAQMTSWDQDCYQRAPCYKAELGSSLLRVWSVQWAQLIKLTAFCCTKCFISQWRQCISRGSKKLQFALEHNVGWYNCFQSSFLKGTQIAISNCSTITHTIRKQRH